MPKNFVPQDQYFKKAKELGYRARSAFKLEEIQKKFRLLKPGSDVLDLGAAPGSWLQYASKIVGQHAKLVGLDLQPIESLGKNIKTFTVDIFSPEAEELIKKYHPETFPIILSDLAPATSGQKELDHLKSVDLNQQVVDLAEKFLSPRGTMVLKIFQGGELNDFVKELKNKFRKVDIYKPKASRSRSFEIYIIAVR